MTEKTQTNWVMSQSLCNLQSYWTDGECGGVWDMTEKLSPTEDVDLSGSESHLPVLGL